MRALSTPAIVLRARDFGESDRIVTLLTRDAGKISGIAKGAKRSQRRFAGALGLFAHVALDYRSRPGADLAFLERTTLLSRWGSLLDSLERYAAASHVVELADKMTAEQEVGDELYGVVLAALRRIDAAEPVGATLRLVELASLAACGYRMELVRCAACREPLLERPGPAHVAPAAGGATCAPCGSPEATAPRLSSGALECLVVMQRAVGEAASPAGATAAGLFDCEAEIARRLDATTAGELAAGLGALLAPHVRGRLRAIELLGPILVRASALTGAIPSR